jgi:site-specific DNA-methyltransferase (adenine-specific)
VTKSSDVPTAIVGAAKLEQADALKRYAHWPAPTCIVVDGPYGVSGFLGDPASPKNLG